MAVLAGLCVAGVVYGRREARRAWPSWPFLAAGLLALGYVLAEGSFGAGLFSQAALVRAAGVALVLAAAWSAGRGSRDRSRAGLLLCRPPVSIDEAVSAIRAGRPGPVGAFTGRLVAQEPVVSPGGIVCGAYEAQVRGAAPGARKGRLLSVEQDSSSGLYVEGERCRARIAFAPGSLWAEVRTRPCRVSARFSCAAGELLGVGGSWEQVRSHERVARLGQPCLVIGQLARAGREGSYLIRGPSGGPAIIAVGEQAVEPGQKLAMRARVRFALAAVWCVCGAYLLAQ